MMPGTRRLRMGWKQLRYVLLAVVILGLSRYVWTNLDDFRVIRLLDTRLFLLLLALHLLMFCFVALPFHRVLQGFRPDFPFSTWLRVYTTSRIVSIFAPQAAAAYRGAELKLSHGVPVSSYLAALGMFTLMSRLLTVIFAATAVLVFTPDLRIGGMPLAPVLACGVLAILLALWLLARFPDRYRSRVRAVLGKLGAHPSVAEEMLGVLRNPRILLYVAVPTLVNFVLSLVSHGLIFSALGAEVNYGKIAVLRLSRSVLEVLPLTPGNIGVSEVVYGSLSEAMALPASGGIIVSAILTVLSMSTVLVAFTGSRLVSRLLARISHRREVHRASE